MFQFRGTGPLKQTAWEIVIFSMPSETQDKLPRDPPKAPDVPMCD
jgi:hypothetical protein